MRFYESTDSAVQIRLANINPVAKFLPYDQHISEQYVNNIRVVLYKVGIYDVPGTNISWSFPCQRPVSPNGNLHKLNRIMFPLVL